MITSIVSSLIHSKRRAVLELISPRLKKLWKEWDLQVMVLLSLVLQIVLIIMGNRRKYSHKLWIRFIVWCAYISADSVATLALGVLTNNLADYKENSGCNLDANAQLTAFWAPFLLLHLGGPDTITAYALEDNELWLRHFLGLIVQTGTTIYIFVMTWTGSRLSIMFILMFFAGLIKYGERTLALRSATNERLRLKLGERSQGYTEYSEQQFNMIRTAKSDEGYCVGVDMTNISKEFPLHHISFSNNNSAPDGDGDKLLAAYELREATLSLFLDSTLTFSLRDRIHSGFRNMSPQNAFRVIEMELGLIYDLLYTKTTLLYKPFSLVLRLIIFLLTCFVFLFFTFLDHKHKYLKIDIFITFLLLAVAIILDVYSALVLLFSDRFFAWLVFDKKISTLRIPTCFQPSKSPRWSNKMRHISFLSCFIKLNSVPSSIISSLGLENLEFRWLAFQYEEISEDLKILIFEYFKGKAAVQTPTTTSRSENQNFQGREACDWMIDEAPKFEEDPAKAILFWHIVTELSFVSDRDEQNNKQFNEIDAHCNLINRISRYMLYLLVKHPSMVSVGITQIRFQKTVESAANCISSSAETEAKACEDILTTNAMISDRLLVDAISHTKRILQEKKDLKEKWNTLREIWFGMMEKAARKCKGREHAQQLRRGGELLTHVWLLMAHFGLTDHFQISDRHQIGTLIVK